MFVRYFIFLLELKNDLGEVQTSFFLSLILINKNLTLYYNIYIHYVDVLSFKEAYLAGVIVKKRINFNLESIFFLFGDLETRKFGWKRPQLVKLNLLLTRESERAA